MASLSPDDILSKHFSVTLRRGYEKQEVDDFLQNVADALRVAQDKAARGTDVDPFEALGKRVSGVLRAASETAGKVRDEAADEANDIRRRAADKALEIRKKAQLEAEDLLSRARKQAEGARREAESHAARVKDEVKRERSELLDESLARRDRLVAHERDLRHRVAEIESLLEKLREELAEHVQSHDEVAVLDDVTAANEPDAAPAQNGEMADTG